MPDTPHSVRPATLLLPQSAHLMAAEASLPDDSLPTEGKKLYSQKNEELIIRHFFKDRRDGFFVDVGCFQWKTLSTTELSGKAPGLERDRDRRQRRPQDGLSRASPQDEIPQLSRDREVRRAPDLLSRGRKRRDLLGGQGLDQSLLRHLLPREGGPSSRRHGAHDFPPRSARGTT